MNLTPTAISILIGTVLPMIVGLVSKGSFNSAIKASLLASLSAVSSVLAQWLDAVNNQQHFAWQAVVISALLTWATGELTYLKVWKPSGAAVFAQSKLVKDDTSNLDLAYDFQLPVLPRRQTI